MNSTCTFVFTLVLWRRRLFSGAPRLAIARLVWKVMAARQRELLAAQDDQMENWYSEIQMICGGPGEYSRVKQNSYHLERVADGCDGNDMTHNHAMPRDAGL